MYVPTSLNLPHKIIFFFPLYAQFTLWFTRKFTILFTRKKKENCSQDLCPVKIETPNLLYRVGGAGMLKTKKALPGPVPESVANEIKLLNCLKNSERKQPPSVDK